MTLGRFVALVRFGIAPVLEPLPLRATTELWYSIFFIGSEPGVQQALKLVSCGTVFFQAHCCCFRQIRNRLGIAENLPYVSHID